MVISRPRQPQEHISGYRVVISSFAMPFGIRAGARYLNLALSQPAMNSFPSVLWLYGL